MSDLIERLRMINPSVSTLYKTRLEAADEIERLRAVLERMWDEFPYEESAELARQELYGDEEER